MRVLLVDDEPDVARALGRLLSRNGYHVDVVTCAADGLARLEATAPQIVISDYRMPDVNGIAFLTEVRRRRPGVHTFLLSGALGPDAETCDVGPTLWKPWDNDAILATIRRSVATQ